MPHLNARGDVLGSASVEWGPLDARQPAGVWINGQLIATHGSGAVWLRPHQVLYQAPPSDGLEYHLRVYDTTTRTSYAVDLQGANLILSGGGIWAAYLSAANAMRTNGAVVYHGTALMAIGHDATLAVLRHPGDGTGLQLISRTGTTVDPPGAGVVTGVTVAHFGLGIWQEGPTIVKAWGRAAPQLVPEAVGQMHILQDLDGEPLLVYHAQDRVLVQRWDEPRGYVVTTVTEAESAYWIDARRYGSTLRIVWAARAGDLPEDLRQREIDLRAPRIALIAAPSEPDPLPVDSIPDPLTPPRWLCWWKDDGGAPANCRIAGQPDGPGPYVVDWFAISAFAGAWDQVVAVVVHPYPEPTDPQIVANVVANAKQTMRDLGLPPKPVTTYTGDKNHVAVGADWVGLAVYLTNADTYDPERAVEQFRLLHAQLSDPSVPIVLWGRDYDQRGYNDPTRRPATIAEGWCSVNTRASLLVHYAQLLEAYPQIVMLGLFNWTARQGGATDYPELDPYRQRLRASVGVPSNQEIDLVKPPRVTVSDFSNEGKPQNWRLAWTDGENAGYGGAVEVTDGRVTVVYRNPAGEARTGAVRVVA